MEKKTIAVDIVGVLLDAIAKFIDEFNETYHANRKKSDITRWDFYFDWDLSESEFFDLFYTTYEKMMEIPFIDKKAPDYLKKLYKNNEVSILSAGDPRFRTKLLEKLKHHEISEGVQFKDLIIVPERPWDLKLSYDFDIYVDDNPNLVEPIKKMSGKSLLLFDQPWNQKSTCKENVVRVYDWNDVYETIKGLEK